MKAYQVSIFLFLANVLSGQNNPAPSIIQLVPPSAKPGDGAFTLTVVGANFISDSKVEWNGSALATQFVSPDQLKASVTASDLKKATTAEIKVSSPPPGGGISSVAYFSVQVASATLALAPDSQQLEPGVAAVGDFNGDGKLDLVIANGCNSYLCSPTLDFYAGNGNGTFAAPIRTLVNLSENIFCQTGNDDNFSIVSLFVADFNADGKSDVAFNTFDGDGDDSQSGTILLSNGDGTFTQSGCYFDSVTAMGGLNGDGPPDLVATGPSGGQNTPEATIWLANPDGTYTLGQQFEWLFGFPAIGAAVGDFNGDGKLDVAFGMNFEVDVALGNGDGTFQTPVQYNTSNQTTNVVAVDLNHDGKLDLLTDGVCVLLGNGDGTFTNGPCNTAPTRLQNAEAPGSMVTGDFNTDGKVDVAILGGNPPAIYVYLGNGDGTFGSPSVYGVPESPLYPFTVGSVIELASGDFEGYGRMGFATSGNPNAATYSQTVASVAPTSVNFGNQPLSQNSAPQTITFKNIEPFSLNIVGLAIRGTDSESFHQTDDCGPSLSGSSSCTIQVVFNPKSLGSQSAFLIVSYDRVGSPQIVPLNGVGVMQVPAK